MANITLGAGSQNLIFERSGQDDTLLDFRSLYFQSALDEAQEVPPNVDIAGIAGSGTGAIDFARTRFEFSLIIEGINLGGGAGLDDMTDMHIHDATVGATGPVIFDFRNDAETAVDPGAGTVTGGWDANEAVALDMTAANVTALLAGNTYFNIHTNRDTSGFIRGQILQDGGGGDRIDLTELNIGSFASLLAITTEVAGDAVVRASLGGEASVLRFDGVERADLRANHFNFAGSVAETIGGNAGRDDLFGAGGRDTLTGLSGNDRLFGEDGGDTLDGGNGRDTIVGGTSRDVMAGGAMDDDFVFNAIGESGSLAVSADRITDFAPGLDDIVLSAIDARPDLPGNQAFTFIGNAAFNAAGQVQATQTGGNTFVSLNTSGTDGAEMVIRLTGLVDVTGADFVL